MKRKIVYEAILGTKFSPDDWDKMADSIAALGDEYDVCPKWITGEPQSLSITRADGKRFVSLEINQLYWYCLGVAAAHGIRTKHDTSRVAYPMPEGID